MAEGGFFPWKVQKINAVPSVNYNSLSKPLKAPKGTYWSYDRSTKEWSIQKVPKVISSIEGLGDEEIIIADAAIVDENGTIEGEDASLSTLATTPFIEHIIQPTDTFEGLCLRYKVTPTEIRRANDFTGSNLNLAPNPLKIPRDGIVKETSLEARHVNDNQQQDFPPLALTTGQVIRVLRKVCPNMAESEAKAYLELNDWDLGDALENAREDGF
jgi:hypothetical protein